MTPTRVSLREACIDLGVPVRRKLSPTEPLPVPIDARPVVRSGSVLAVLLIAYERRCWVYGLRGECEHREPDVELARMGARAR